MTIILKNTNKTIEVEGDYLKNEITSAKINGETIKDGDDKLKVNGKELTLIEFIENEKKEDR